MFEVAIRVAPQMGILPSLLSTGEGAVPRVPHSGCRLLRGAFAGSLGRGGRLIFVRRPGT